MQDRNSRIERNRRYPAWVALGACVATFAVGSIALGGGCHIPLAIGEVSVAPSVSGGGVLELRGIWEFEGVMQTDFPLSILVVRGEDFVRYPVGRPAETGTLGGLADGLQLEEIEALEAVGTAEPEARVLRMDEHSMSLALPSRFGRGLVSVVLYRALDAERLGVGRHEVRPASFSNTVAVYYGVAS